MAPKQVEIVLFAPDASGRLLTAGTDTGRQPVRLVRWRMQIAEEERVLPRARRELADRFGIERPVLEVHVPEGVESMATAPILLVLEPAEADSPAPEGSKWQALDRLPPAALPAALVERAGTWLDELSGRVPVPQLRSAWSQVGWHARVRSWLDEALAAAGRRRSGPLEPMRMWGISALLRCETDNGAVWVKAAFPPFRAEPAITLMLAERFPRSVPRIVAANEAKGWLALEDLGDAVVGDGKDEDLKRVACDLLIDIQRAMADRTDELLRAGAAARGLDDLADDLTDAFFGEPQVVDWAQSAERRRQIVGHVRREAADLAALGVPATLVHGDFHPWNVAVVDGRPVIFDWTDAAIGHPLLDFVTWVERAEDEGARQRIWSEWVESWSDIVPRERLEPRFGQVFALGAAYQVDSYVRILRALEPAARTSLMDGPIVFARFLDETNPG